MSEYPIIDHKAKAISRLLVQFSEAAILQGYIKALLSEADNIEKAIQDTIDLRTIDSATGATLDIIGVLVGQPRILLNATALVFFGYDGHLSADSYGDLDDSSLGARYISAGEPLSGNRVLNDEEYRLFIRARIAKNHSNGSINSVAYLASFVTGTDLIVIQEGPEPATFNIGFGRKLDANTKTFLANNNLIPKPAGVRIAYFYDFPTENPFGFAGAPGNVQGYGAGEYADIF